MTGLWFSLALLSLQSPPPQALKELLVISGEETGEYLSTVSDITVDRRGRIYVAQPQDHSIIVFEKTGTFAARFGRQGSGPGEFRGLRTLTWVGDTLFSVDATLLRLSGFNSSGQHVGDAPRVASHLPDGLVGMGPRTILSNRTIIAIPQYRTGRKPVPIQLYARDGAYIKSLGEVVNSGENYRVQVGKVVSQFSAMVRWSTILATSPVGDGIVIVDPGPPTTGTAGSYTITRVGLNGNVLFRKAVQYTPLPIASKAAQAEIDSFVPKISAMAMKFGQPISRAAVEKAAREVIEIPKFNAPVDAALLGRDGRVWLRQGDLGGRVATWEILDARGRLTGRVTVPKSVKLFYVDGDRAYGVKHTELDVPQIVVYSAPSRQGRG